MPPDDRADVCRPSRRAVTSLVASEHLAIMSAVHDAFRWNDHNVQHIARHGVEIDEAEYIVSTLTADFRAPKPTASTGSGAKLPPAGICK